MFCLCFVYVTLLADIQRAEETKYLVDSYKRMRSWLAGGTWREKAWAARVKPFGSKLGRVSTASYWGSELLGVKSIVRGVGGKYPMIPWQESMCTEIITVLSLPS